MNNFEILALVNCSEHVEKKGKFTYLSWPFAFAELFKRFPTANITVREWNDFPATQNPNGGWFVHVSVTIDDVTRSQWHPILNGNNKPIEAPSVFDINTSIQRATVKAIALHGLGLYIYAGEDLPQQDEQATVVDEFITEKQCADLKDLIESHVVDYPKFLEAFDITKLSEMKASRLQGAINSVNKKPLLDKAVA